MLLTNTNSQHFNSGKHQTTKSQHCESQHRWSGSDESTFWWCVLWPCFMHWLSQRQLLTLYPHCCAKCLLRHPQVDILQMHGTGTSLGDPIEVGAAAAVFSQRAAAASGCTPLALITSKSSLGHAEPAAGIVGAFHSLNAVQQAALPPLMHLRTLNPFVASALATGIAAEAFSLPRQLAPRALTAGRDQGLVAGVSSFAFQVRAPCQHCFESAVNSNIHQLYSGNFGCQGPGQDKICSLGCQHRSAVSVYMTLSIVN